jgi:hypothetical protein
MTITDEMVDKAENAYWQCRSLNLYGHMRTALETVAPMLIAPYQRALEACNGALANSGAAYALALADRNKLIAQGMREAAATARGDMQFNLERAILDRAQELDPR